MTDPMTEAEIQSLKNWLWETPNNFCSTFVAERLIATIQDAWERIEELEIEAINPVLVGGTDG